MEQNVLFVFIINIQYNVYKLVTQNNQFDQLHKIFMAKEK